MCTSWYSAASLVLNVTMLLIRATYAVTLTMLAFDCLMALSYHWFSTMYGVWFFANCMRGALSVSVVLMCWLLTRGLRTLFVRYRQASANALKNAERNELSDAVCLAAKHGSDGEHRQRKQERALGSDAIANPTGRWNPHRDGDYQCAPGSG